MTDFDEKDFYERIGRENGWDFRSLKVHVEGALWDFYPLVASYSTERPRLLDIGSGGGELLLENCRNFRHVVGIDRSVEMIKKAQELASLHGGVPFRFCQMDSAELLFLDGSFDIVSCRHAPFHPHEVYRVLGENGIFVTQQVSEHDKFDLKMAFQRGQSFGVKDGAQRAAYVEALHAAGFARIEVQEYNAVEYYPSVEDLIFLLKHTPIIPHFGEQDCDFQYLRDYVNVNRDEKGIRTNSKRYLITAFKGKGEYEYR
ncbi:class I SAM-dependent methyltransferase [Paenibacillus turpanensis]|uniref:class I SAM-dependent methyltransferase n=1 Tax=Paenibacillus turpanensis TaxID=2689078 RepID=UPI00140A52DA|nr:class I SAM-dependent methyltransferase [Paenibacillus turpanensis]